MTTYARIVGGYAVDVAITPPELKERFHPEWLARQNFIVVPDGTLSGATDNGNGTFSNPPPTVPVTTDAILSRAELISHCMTQFGTNARWGAVILSARTATDPTIAGLYEQYTALPSFTKAQAQGFFIALRVASLPSGAIVTVAEITAIVTNWPKVQM